MRQHGFNIVMQILSAWIPCCKWNDGRHEI